jgi:hypothetical protein
MGESMIPNILHFVFGMAPDFGGKPFSLCHYLSVRSAVELNKPDKAILHYQYEPEGEWWLRAKPFLTLNKIIAPDSFMGRPLYHVAHKADVIRLQALKETGGIYMDLDTISVRPLTELLIHSCIISQFTKTKPVPKNWRQRIKFKIGWIKDESKIQLLCNVVMLAEKKSGFINLWLDEYKTFRSKGRDIYWDEHAVKVPTRLAALYPEMVTRPDPHMFNYPLYDKEGLSAMFKEVHSFPGAYIHHLWESFSWELYLSKLTSETIKTKDTTYNLIARKYL